MDFGNAASVPSVAFVTIGEIRDEADPSTEETVGGAVGLRRRNIGGGGGGGGRGAVQRGEARNHLDVEDLETGAAGVGPYCKRRPHPRALKGTHRVRKGAVSTVRSA